MISPGLTIVSGGVRYKLGCCPSQETVGKGSILNQKVVLKLPGGPLLVINGVITLTSRVITLVTHL